MSCNKTRRTFRYHRKQSPPAAASSVWLRDSAAFGLGATLAKAGQARTVPADFTLPTATDSIAPFKVSFSSEAIVDLKYRLDRTRWPDKETVGDWSQGVPLAKMQALADYWRSSYDLHRVEQRLNAFPQFRTRIDGLGIHFLHVRSKHENALPLILTHGRPGSVVEFLKVIGPLTDPTAHGGKAEDAFHVVVPSLPGYGFSDKPAESGWGLPRIREGLGRPDEASRLYQVGRAGRRLGCRRDHMAGQTACGGARRGSPEPADPVPTSDRG